MQLFNKVPLEGNINKLPLGILTDKEEILRDITYRIVSRSELKMIHDKKYAQNHPFKWMARTLCLCVESINGIPVFEDFERSGFKTFPAIVQEIACLDLYFVLLCGHIHNFGYIINNVMANCGDCGKKSSFDLNLKTLVVSQGDGNYHKFSVNLETGFSLKEPNSQESKVYKMMDCRRPILRDALNYESDYRSNGQGMFNEKVYAACIEAMYDTEGQTLDTARMHANAPALLSKMGSLDSAIMETEFNEECPQLSTDSNQTCGYCSADIEVLVQTGFLFPIHL